MAYDEHTANRVRRLLSKQRGVLERKMMGTLAFMVNGSLCCAVGSDWMLVRVAPEDRTKILAGPHVEPMMMRDRPMRGFVRVAAEGFQSGPALAKWVEKGRAAAAGVRKTGKR